MPRLLPTLIFPLLVLLSASLRAAASEPLTFYPDWFPGTQFAGVYVALDRGIYRDAGLDVSLVPFAYGQKAAQLIAAHPDVTGVATVEGYIFLQKRAAGDDLLALGAMLQQGPAGYMSLRQSGIKTLADFSGKTIGVHKFADPLYHWFLQRAGLPESSAKMVFVGNDLDQLTRGDVDVMQGFATEEFVQLKKIVGTDARFLSFADLGFDSYSQIVVTNSAQVKTHADALRRFLAATRQGWQRAFDHPDEAVAAVHARVGPDCDDAFQRDALTALRDYICPHGIAPMPPLDPAKLKKLEETCIAIGFLKSAEPVEKFLVTLEAPAK
jgi:NitT/TauT family transport system substrate-binding protein